MEKMKTLIKGTCFILVIPLCLIKVILSDSVGLYALGTSCKHKPWLPTSMKTHMSNYVNNKKIIYTHFIKIKHFLLGFTGA